MADPTCNADYVLFTQNPVFDGATVTKPNGGNCK